MGCPQHAFRKQLAGLRSRTRMMRKSRARCQPQKPTGMQRCIVFATPRDNNTENRACTCRYAAWDTFRIWASKSREQQRRQQCCEPCKLTGGAPLRPTTIRGSVPKRQGWACVRRAKAWTPDANASTTGWRGLLRARVECLEGLLDALVRPSRR